MRDTFRETFANHPDIVGAQITTTTTRTDCESVQSVQHQYCGRVWRVRGSAANHQSTMKKSACLMQQIQRRRRRRQHNNSESSMPTKETPRRRSSVAPRRLPSSALYWLAITGALLLACTLAVMADDAQAAQRQQNDPRSTQPTLDRQLESPSSGSSSSSSSSSVVPAASNSAPAGAKPVATAAPKQSRPLSSSSSSSSSSATLANQKRAAAQLAAHRDYDKYQLKASSSNSPARVSAESASATAAAAAATSDLHKQQAVSDKEKEKAGANNGSSNNNKQSDGATSAAAASSSSSSSSSGVEPAHKKVGQLPNTRPHPKASAFSLLRKFLPSFMTSAAAAAAAASASAVADKQPHQNQHSRSSPTASSSLLSSLLSSAVAASSSGAVSGHQSSSGSSFLSGGGGGGNGETGNSPLTGRIINLLTGAQKKKGLPEAVALHHHQPNHAPFFMRKSATDRQAAGGGGALALASGLLSNPLKLGLLFSAPLLPSLLLTPLAIAGLSPAMSAINNFFGDDDEPSSSSSGSQSSVLSALGSGASSPLASILQATGAVSPFGSSSSSSSSSTGGASSSDLSQASSNASPASSNSLALQAFQSFVLGPTSTTERPLFKPGMFVSSNGIQQAAGALGSALSSATGQASSANGASGGTSSSGQRPLFGSGGLMQAAASMISPSFAAPPSSVGGGGSASGSSAAAAASGDDDGPGLMQMASDVFEKVANYMGTENNKDGQALAQATAGPSSPINSPLSTLASLTSMSPFQLSSLFSGSPFGQSLATASSAPSATGSSSSSSSNKNQRVGFLSTLRNVYELFSSSFLRRQEVGGNGDNECQQRLVCELHQRAMNSKLFRRSLQTSLSELASLDKNLIDQIRYGSQALQARVDPDTKAMLNDFLKASQSFKSGREMINCSQMFPKCTRTQLLAAANAHLNDPVNGRAIGKFSQLMKKMKFKANQQSTSQWKLRKPGKSAAPSGFLATVQQQQQPGQVMVASQPLDHMQVVPLQQASDAAAGQLTPVDSLKLAQQIMLLSQMNQQQQQQPRPTNPPAFNQYAPNGGIAQVQPQQQQQQWSQPSSQTIPQPAGVYQQNSAVAASYSPAVYSAGPMQYSPAPKQQQTTYTDAMAPTIYSPTDSPYFMQQQQQQQQSQQYMGGNSGAYPAESNQQLAGANQQLAPQQQQQQQIAGTNQQQPAASYQSAVGDQSQQQVQQQQQSLRAAGIDINKGKPQQLVAPNKMIAIPA